MIIGKEWLRDKKWVGSLHDDLFEIVNMAIDARERSNGALASLSDLSICGVNDFRLLGERVACRLSECINSWVDIIYKVFEMVDLYPVFYGEEIGKMDSVAFPLEDVLSNVHQERVLETIRLVCDLKKEITYDSVMLDFDLEKLSKKMCGVVSVAGAAIGDFGENWRVILEDRGGKNK